MDTKMTHGNLHVYPQEFWHEDAFIVADRAALLALRNLIDKVLAPGPGFDKEEFFASDGEGYSLHVVDLEGDEGWNKIGTPYTGDMSREKRDSAVWPWEIVKMRKERKA